MALVVLAVVGCQREAAAQLPPGFELKPHSASDTPLACDDAAGNDTGRVFVERQYEVVHPDTWPTGELFAILERYWKSRNYHIVQDTRTATDMPTLSASHPDDGTDVGIRLYPRYLTKVDVYLFGDSTCVWESGTAP